ncbi:MULTISPECIES: hypothetical protein [unclassified Mameliella]|uniref:hypothetical protein n=1 Tax=Mameliella sp. LZ-28 TaxID=2484146 RepID=UPI00143F51BE|nr:hypothetical protein [Mameliella sp. LZ-28]MCR9276231.1 hypothetical protein [Paracoccaceae bacterium]
MKHLPNYNADERTRYDLRLQIEGCVVWTRGHLTLEEAQAAYITWRDESGLGGSDFASGEVFDQFGQHIARISYNGRLWEPLPWHPGMSCLAEAPTIAGAAA